MSRNQRWIGSCIVAVTAVSLTSVWAINVKGRYSAFGEGRMTSASITLPFEYDGFLKVNEGRMVGAVPATTGCTLKFNIALNKHPLPAKNSRRTMGGEVVHNCGGALVSRFNVRPTTVIFKINNANRFIYTGRLVADGRTGFQSQYVIDTTFKGVHQ